MSNLILNNSSAFCFQEIISYFNRTLAWRIFLLISLTYFELNVFGQRARKLLGRTEVLQLNRKFQCPKPAHEGLVLQALLAKSVFWSQMLLNFCTEWATEASNRKGL